MLADVAAFVARNKARFDGYVPPDVALIVPTAEQLSPRSLSAMATRATVRAFYEDIGVSLRAVADHRAARDLGRPRVMLLPACRSISDAGWQAIINAPPQDAIVIHGELAFIANRHLVAAPGQFLAKENHR